jgi:hypothetical protein
MLYQSLGRGETKEMCCPNMYATKGKGGGGGVKFDLINMSQHRGGRLIFQNDLNIPLTYAVGFYAPAKGE